MPARPFPSTEYFQKVRLRPDRAKIRDEWILRAIASPLREHVQADGRVRLWSPVPEAGGRILRVVVLVDRQTVHNAFFDRTFRP